MKISLLSEYSIRLEPQTGMLTIEAPDANMSYSPFHMLASGIATCSWSVLASWATNAGIDFADLAIEVGWTFAEEPHRVGAISMELDWPSLPQERAAAAKRAAALCAIHATFEHPPEIQIELRK